MISATKSISTHWQFTLIPLVLALCSCQHRIPPEFEYSPGWMTEEHPSANARALKGVVTDANGAPMEHVLVERTTADFKTRLDARLTDSAGRFHFQWTHKGTSYLRFRYRAFNDYCLPVQVSSRADRSSLNVKLDVSN